MADIRDEFESWLDFASRSGEIGKAKTEEQKRHDQLVDMLASAISGDGAPEDEGANDDR